MEVLKNKSLAAFFICCTFLFSVTLYQQKQNNWGAQNEITWDAAGYYMYLPSLFYDQLSQLHNRQYIIDHYNPGGGDISAHRAPTGKYVMKYASGQAIMFLPGFAIGHVWAKLGGYPVDGFSAPYQLAIALYSVFFCCIGLWFIRKALKLYFDDSPVAIALLVLCFATNYLNFSTFSNRLTHAYLFTIYSLLIYLSISWRNKPGYLKAIMLGLLAGLAALTRPTDIICVIIPLAWGISNFKDISARIKLFAKEWRMVLLFCASAICMGSIQLLYWKRMSGHFLYWSYDDPGDGFNFLRVPINACLFSYDKGWWVYTPVMVLSAIGFIPLLLRRRNLFWTPLSFSLIALYIVFSWKNWTYGGSFSMRAVVQYYAVLIFPLTAFFDWVRSNIVAKTATAIFCIFCTWLNLTMTYQANVSGVMESERMTKKYFWAIFGKPEVSVERRRLIDTDEDLPEQLKSKLKVIYTDTAALSANYHDTIWQGKKLFMLDKDHNAFPKANVMVAGISSGWFRLHSYVSMWQWEGNIWKSPSIYACFFDEKGNQVKYKAYFIQRVVGYSSDVNDMYIDIKVPEGQQIKTLKGGITHNGSYTFILSSPVWVEYAPLN